MRLSAAIAAAAIVLTIPAAAERADRTSDRRRAADPAAQMPSSISILRPSDTNEVQQKFFAVQWPDGQRSVVKRTKFGPVHDGRLWWSVDLDKGTYTARRLPDERPRRERDVMVNDYCQPTEWDDGSTCNGSGGNASGYASGYIGYLDVSLINDLGGPLEAGVFAKSSISIMWGDCRNGDIMVHAFDYDCDPGFDASGQHVMNTQCFPNYPTTAETPSARGQLVATYTKQNNSEWARDILTAEVFPRGHSEIDHIFTSLGANVVAVEDPSGQITQVPRCPSDANADDSDDNDTEPSNPYNPTETCVPVINAETGEELGTCCGYTVQQLFDCAEGYRNSN